MSTVSFNTDYGQATIRLFRGNKTPKSSSAVVFVSHGWQLTPPAIVTQDTRLPSFAWFVPQGHSLERTNYTNWLGDLSSRFVESRLAFCTSGIPAAIVGAHYADSRDTRLEGVLAQAIANCDVAVFEDMTSSGKGTGDFNDTAAIPLQDLLSSWPAASGGYSSFMLHACRASWPPKLSGGGIVAKPSGLYSYNDDFRSLSD